MFAGFATGWIVGGGLSYCNPLSFATSMFFTHRQGCKRHQQSARELGGKYYFIGSVDE
jgi:hypothetical protein